mgnify:FL=1
MKKILIVEDDISIHNLIKEILLSEHYKILDAYSGSEAIMILEKENVDLILLDLMLPSVNGEEIIKKFSQIPIVVISAKISVDDKIKNLLNGADDYITKPFNNEELLARVKARLRNKDNYNYDLKFKELKLSIDSRILYVCDNKVNLTKTEYAILKQLLLSPNKVISKNKMLELISFDTPDCDENSLKVHISNLKKKIQKFSNKKYIESVWGIGYKIFDD